MNFSARSTFKKLLGKGRAWLTPKGFTEDVLNLFAYPFEVVKDVLIKLKLTHFPVTYTNENNASLPAQHAGEQLIPIVFHCRAVRTSGGGRALASLARQGLMSMPPRRV